MKIGRNEPCPCGSGKKYKKCHGSSSSIPFISEEAIKQLQKQMIEGQIKDQRLRAKGIYVNYVKPILFKGQKIFAIGNEVYYNRRPNETFHEFLLFILKKELGPDWLKIELNNNSQHFLIQCLKESEKWAKENMTQANQFEDGVYGVPPNGYTQYLLSVAYDIATLKHSMNLPKYMLDNLKKYDYFQSARYELAIAAIFMRLGFKIEFLDLEAKDEVRCEFIAEHIESKEKVVIEVKSRRRSGVLHEPGDISENPAPSLEKLIKKAKKKTQKDLPFLIFIDANYPPAPDLSIMEKPWVKDVQGILAKWPEATHEEPEKYYGLGFTNYTYHFEKENLARGDVVLFIKSLFPNVEVKLPFFLEMVTNAIQAYGFVPSDYDL